MSAPPQLGDQVSADEPTGSRNQDDAISMAISAHALPPSPRRA
jgi:hypothetical protein